MPFAKQLLRSVLVAGFLAGGFASQGIASDIRTYPTRLNLTPAAAIGSIMVRNNNTTKAVIQIEVVGWSQDKGEDKYVPTREILVNPVIFDLAPAADQVVRVGLQGGVGDVERSYRVFLQEIPARDAPPQNGITTLLQIGIPVFVPPKAPVYDLQWHVHALPQGKVAVEAVNKGNVHIQVTGLTLTNEGGDQLVQSNVFAYVMPGQSRQWELAPTKAVHAGETISLGAATDYQDLKTQMVIGPAEDRAGQK